MRKLSCILCIVIMSISLFAAITNAADIYLNGQIKPGNYQTEWAISTGNPSSVIIGDSVTLKSGLGVELGPGFSVESGGNIGVYTLDDDGLPNKWEMENFGTLSYSMYDDTDQDGITNIEEYLEGSNPANPDAVYDFSEILTISGELKTKLYSSGGKIIAKSPCSVGSDISPNLISSFGTEIKPGFAVYSGGSFGVMVRDNDGLPNEWEAKYFGTLSNPADGDKDLDGLTNAEELLLGSNPVSIDSDGDGVLDTIEVEMNTDIASADSTPSKGVHYKYDAIGRIKKIIRIY